MSAPTPAKMLRDTESGLDKGQRVMVVEIDSPFAVVRDGLYQQFIVLEEDFELVIP